MAQAEPKKSFWKKIFHEHLNPHHHLRKLGDIRAKPEAIAGGVAIGIFIGFIPLWGIKTLLALLIAWLLRCSKLAAVILVNLHDILLPLMPVLLHYEYKWGYWLLSHPHGFPPKLSLVDIHISDVLQWTFIFDVALPLLVGSLPLAIVAAIASYYLTHPFLRWYGRWDAARRARKAAEQATTDSP